MKTKITRNRVYEEYPYVIECGYCALQNLLSCMEPRHYTCGVYGWNADVYAVSLDVAIVTGYRPFGKYNGNKLAREYDKRAEAINAEFRWGDYEKRKAEFEKLIAEYVAEVIAE